MCPAFDLLVHPRHNSLKQAPGLLQLLFTHSSLTYKLLIMALEAGLILPVIGALSPDGS